MTWPALQTSNPRRDLFDLNHRPCASRFAKSARAGLAGLLVMTSLLAARPARADFDATLFNVFLWAQAEAGEVLAQDLQSYNSVSPGNYIYNASASQGGSSASGDLEVGVVVQPLPEKATITFKADADTSVPAGVPSSEFAGAYTDGGLFVSFSVPETACVRVTAQGSMSTTGGNARLVYDRGPGIQVATGHDTHQSSESVNVDTTTAIPTGIVHIGIEFTANAYSDPDEPILEGKVAMDLTITVEVLPEVCGEVGNEDCEAAIYFWEGLNGAYGDESNWEPECVPGEDLTAVFDKDQTYTVNFGNEKAGLALIERGEASFSGGKYLLPGGSTAAPSFVVGNDSSDKAELWLIEDHELTTNFAAVGLNPGTDGTVRVSYPGFGAATWDVGEKAVAGSRGRGTIEVSGAGRMTAQQVVLGAQADGRGKFHAYEPSTEYALIVSTLDIGVDGVGELIVDGHRIVGTVVALGVNDGADGSILVTRDTSPGVFEFNAMTVGDGGVGTVTVEKGSLLSRLSEESTLILGNQSDGDGVMLVTGCGTLANVWDLSVGRSGQGFLSILDGAEVNGNLVDIADGQEGQGQVVVDGQCEDGTPSNLGMETFYVGFRGTGLLKIANGATATCGDAYIGLFHESTGLVLVEGEDARLRVDERLVLGEIIDPDGVGTPPVGIVIVQGGGKVSAEHLSVYSGSGIYGGGVITLTGDTPAVIQGEIGPGIMVLTQSKQLKQAGPAFGRGRGFDTLTIIGDVFCDGSVIVMDIGGDTPGRRDRLIIDGDASLEGVTIKLNFKYGFAPQEGMTIPLIEVTGDGSVMPAALEFTGLEAGFDFDIEIPGDGSVIQMRALNSGTPTSNRAADLNDDGVVNAVDVQLVINGALGLLDPLQTDVNFDEVTNAVDVQLVINAALGL